MEEVIKRNAHIYIKGKVMAAFEEVAKSLNSSAESKAVVREYLEWKMSNRGRRHRRNVKVWRTDASH